MDLSTVASSAGLLNNAISVIKSAREFAKNSSDANLKEKIGAAYEVLLDLREHLLRQDDEIRRLTALLSEKSSYVGPVAPHGYYYADADSEAKQHPLCPSCFQSKPQKIAFMNDAHPWNKGIRRTCKLCGDHIYEKEMDLSAPHRVVPYRPRY